VIASIPGPHGTRGRDLIELCSLALDTLVFDWHTLGRSRRRARTADLR
jgi:hypothetical protein